MNYTLAYLDLDNDYTIQVEQNLNPFQVIDRLAQLTGVDVEAYTGYTASVKRALAAISTYGDMHTLNRMYITAISDSGERYSL